MSNNPPSERRMCSPFIHHPVPTKMLRLGLVSNFQCQHICNNTQFINDWQIFYTNCQSLLSQKMIFLPAHLCPSKTGQTICGILLFLGLVLYRLILLCLRDVIPKNVLVVPHFVLHWQPSAASGHYGGQQGLLCGLGGERGGCFLKKITCVSHLTLFLQVLPIKSSPALWPVAILEYFVLIECPLSPKSPL